MKKYSVILTGLLLCLIPGAPARAEYSLIDPVIYPFNSIGTRSPWVIWQDIYHAENPNDPARYRITIKPGKDPGRKPHTYTIAPERFYKNFFAFKLPIPLENGGYEYRIERLVSGTPMGSRYYHYRKYPIEMAFSLDTDKKDLLDDLDPGRIIQYIYKDRNNTLQNGYNALFFLGSGVFSFGIGMLFYSVIDLGIISTVIYVVAFTSSATGLTAAGYYGVRYMHNRGRLNKILEVEPGVNLGAGRDRDRMFVGCERRF